MENGESTCKAGWKKISRTATQMEGPESVSSFTVNETEVSRQLLKRKHQVQVQLQQQSREENLRKR